MVKGVTEHVRAGVNLRDARVGTSDVPSTKAACGNNVCAEPQAVEGVDHLQQDSIGDLCLVHARRAIRFEHAMSLISQDPPQADTRKFARSLTQSAGLRDGSSATSVESDVVLH